MLKTLNSFSFVFINYRSTLYKFIQRYEGFLFSITYFFIAFLLVTALGFGIEHIVPRDPIVADPTLATEFISYPGVHPKPHDRVLFPLLLSIIVMFLGITALIGRHWKKKIIDFRAIFVFSFLVSIFIAGCLGHGADTVQLFSKSHLLQTLICMLTAVTASLFFIKASARCIQNLRYILLIIVFTTMSALTCYTSIFSALHVDYQPQFTSHFEAAIYSLVHIAKGGTCLADVPVQYGCYGEFIAPLLNLTGMSVFAVTALLTLFQVIAIFAIITFAATLIRNTLLLIAAIICIMLLMNMVYFMGAADPYFQYNPIRLFFPALSLICVKILQKSPSFRNQILSGMFAGAAMTWNLDTGIAVAGALVIFISIICFRKGLFKVLFSFGSGVLLFLLLFTFYIEVKSGWQVNFLSAISYQKMFYISGFAMMPMPPFPDYWTIAILIVGLVLLVAIVRIISFERLSLEEERATYLAILAIGLFLYYTGRSHWSVLRFVVWPEVILFFYCADRALREIKCTYKKVTITTLLISTPLAICCFHFPFLLISLTNLLQPPADYIAMQQDIAFIKSYVKPNEKIGIIAENQATLYLETRTRPALAGPSLAEMQLVKDLQKLEKDIALMGPHKIFINSAAITLGKYRRLPILNAHYHLSARGPENRILYFIRDTQ